jgi:pimeloyl-ACP methyl ester carboxylesterase
MATVAADIAHVLGALAAAGWHRPLVLGQSWGGNLVIELAHRHADLVRGVVGVDGGTIELGTAFPDWSECERLLAPPQLIGIAAASLRERMRSFHPDWSEEALDGAMANMEVLADGTVRPWLTRDRHMAILRGLWEHRPSALWSSIEVPVMLVSALGEHLDAASLAKQAAVDHAVASLRRSRAVWFRPADHDLHAQKPVEFAQTVARALDEGFFA